MSKQTRRTAIAKTMYALDHHAAKLKPLVDTLLYAISGSELLHRWESTRGGNNSWVLHVWGTKTGKHSYYIGWPHAGWQLVVRERARGPVVATMANERDVLRFVGSL